VVIGTGGLAWAPKVNMTMHNDVRRASTRERGLEGLCTLLGPVYNYEEASERSALLSRAALEK
jgi:hypothetical protein